MLPLAPDKDDWAINAKKTYNLLERGQLPEIPWIEILLQPMFSKHKAQKKKRLHHKQILVTSYIYMGGEREREKPAPMSL